MSSCKVITDLLELVGKFVQDFLPSLQTIQNALLNYHRLISLQKEPVIVPV